MNDSVNNIFMISLMAHQMCGFILKTYLNKLQIYCNLLGESMILGTEKKTLAMLNSHALRQ